MSLNTNIPLMAANNSNLTRGLNSLTDAVQGRRKETRAQERHETNQEYRAGQLERQQYDNLDARQKSRLNSVVLGAAELDTYLKRGDFEGAREYLINRKKELGQRIANGEMVDTAETDQALIALEKDPEALREQTVAAIDLGRMIGVFDTQSNKGGATGELIDRAMQDNPNLSFSEALEFVKGGATVDGRNKANIKTGREAAYEVQSGKNESDLGFKPQIAQETSRAEFIEKGFQTLPKIQRSLQSKELKEEFLDKKIASIQERANPWSTGFTGSIASAVAGTDAFDLKSDVETLLANAGFDTLQDMRDNSPTGGALGQVSEREIGLLQAAHQNLMQSQSYEQFQRNLSDFKEQRTRSLENIRRAYEEDYNRFGGERDKFLPAPNSQNNTLSLEEFLNE